jgi:uncharacterized protein YdaU (DUF1376 family)
MNKSPAFQWYPADWLSDMRVRLLPWAAKGLYVDLLCYCWREGYIPADSTAIAQLCGCHDLAMIEQCLELFCVTDDPTKLTHKRLEKERVKQNDHRNERSESGKKGAKARWNKGKQQQTKEDSLANGSAIKQPLAKNGSSSSTATSVLVSTNVDTPLPFDSADFKFFWENWEQHLKEKKKPLKPTARKMQLAKLKEFGEQRAIAALKYSISGNCQGIYEGNESKQKPNYPHKGTEETIQVRNLMNVK